MSFGTRTSPKMVKKAVSPWGSDLELGVIYFLGGGFKHFLFSPLLGEMIQFDEHIFQMGWFNHQLDFPRYLGSDLGPQDLPTITGLDGRAPTLPRKSLRGSMAPTLR